MDRDLTQNYNPPVGASPAYLEGYRDGFYMLVLDPVGYSPAYMSGYEDGSFDATHGGPF
jgi:hypothetical protein